MADVVDSRAMVSMGGSALDYLPVLVVALGAVAGLYFLSR